MSAQPSGGLGHQTRAACRRPGVGPRDPGGGRLLWTDFEAGIDAYAEGRYAAAASRFQPLAERGDHRAQYWLGIMYLAGKGVPEDIVRAHLWLSLAAEQGNRGARINRDGIAQRMNAAQLAAAERQLAAWRKAD